ncbi:MAG TPA: helix-hairpin-helix domain-containing protein [Pirellulales bacterium]|jgi:DNA polymerase/3'-5' exonuclease PolX|nr:helix-hairpin-helix domain-containing protein [Pirellulales bacterium]
MVSASQNKPLDFQTEFVARTLEEIARTLEVQHSNRYRIGAYRRAAQKLRDLHRPLEELIVRDRRGTTLNVPGIGKSLAATIIALADTHHVPDAKGLNPRPGA